MDHIFTYPINNVVPYFKYISIPAGVLDALRLFVWYAYNGMLDCRAFRHFRDKNETLNPANPLTARRCFVSSGVY
jgi:hypothetical protein